MAEATYNSLTLSNFHFELDDAKPVDVKAAMKFGYGGLFPDGPAKLDVEVTADGKLAFSGVASLEDGVVKAALEKSKYRFEIPVEGMENVLFSATPLSPMYSLWYLMPPELYYSLSGAMYDNWYGNSEDGPQPEDFQKAWDLMGRYAAYYNKYLDPAQSKARDRKLFEILKPEPKGQEAVDLFGKLTKLYRYEMAYAGSDLKTYYQAVYQADPELKALEEEAAQLAEAFGFSERDNETNQGEIQADGADSDGDQAPASQGETRDPLDQMVEDAGVVKIAYVIWSDTEVVSDASSRMQKSVMTLTIKDAVDEYGMPVPLEVPITTSWQELSKGRRLGFELDYEPYKGESTKASFHAMLDVPDKSGATVSDVKVALDVNSEGDGVVFSAVLTGKESVDAQGVGDTDVRVKGTADGQDFALGYAYDGKTSTQTEKSGLITLSYSLPADVGLPFEGSIHFDSLVETGPYQSADFSPYKDLQPVNPLRASATVMDKVSGDVNGAMMQGVGVLMQTHGLSSLIGGMMSGLIPQ